jgi:hypothetical protein
MIEGTFNLYLETIHNRLSDIDIRTVNDKEAHSLLSLKLRFDCKIGWDKLVKIVDDPEYFVDLTNYGMDEFDDFFNSFIS